MNRTLGVLGRNAPWFLCGGILIGLALPSLAAIARPLLAPSVVVIVAAGLLRADWAAIGAAVQQPARLVLLVVWLMIACPVLMGAVLLLGPVPPGLAAGIVLMAAAPPILASAALAALLGLDAALASIASVAATLLAPLTVPALAQYLLGIELTLGAGEFMLRLGVIIAASFALTGGIRAVTTPAWRQAHVAQVDGVFVLAMLLFAIAVMEGASATALAEPYRVALWLGVAILANPALQALGALAFARLGRRRALTAGLLTGNRNMGILLAALPSDAASDILLYFALAQIPLYMMPAVLLPVYRRLLASRL